MKLPRLRFSVRWMMVAVVVMALASLGWREYQIRLLGNDFRDPIFNSQLMARPTGSTMKEPYVPGRPFPVTISYDFKLSTPKTSSLILGSIWLEDVAIGKAVDSYMFDAKLTVGEREACSGSFTWDAMVPHPGRYQLRYHRYHQMANGKMQGGNGGGTFHEFLPEAKP